MFLKRLSLVLLYIITLLHTPSSLSTNVITDSNEQEITRSSSPVYNKTSPKTSSWVGSIFEEIKKSLSFFIKRTPHSSSLETNQNNETFAWERDWDLLISHVSTLSYQNLGDLFDLFSFNLTTNTSQDFEKSYDPLKILISKFYIFTKQNNINENNLIQFTDPIIKFYKNLENSNLAKQIQREHFAEGFKTFTELSVGFDEEFNPQDLSLNVLQDGIITAHCLEEISQLQPSKDNLKYARSSLVRLYKHRDGGTLSEESRATLESLNIRFVNQSSNNRILRSYAPGIGFLFLILSHGAISTVSSQPLPGAALACSTTAYTECLSAHFVLDSSLNMPEINFILKNAYYQQATNNTIYMPDRIAALSEMVSIIDGLNSTGYYAQLSTFSFENYPYGNYSGVSYNRNTPYYGFTYSPINETYLNYYQKEYSDLVNYTILQNIVLEQSLTPFFLDTLPNKEYWAFTMMYNTSLGLTTSVIRTESSANLLFNRAITRGGALKPVRPNTFTPQTINTNKPQRAIDTDGSTYDELISSYSGTVGSTDCNGSQTIQQTLTTLGGNYHQDLLSCFNIQSMDPLACIGIFSTHSSIYTRLTFFFLDEVNNSTIMYQKIIDGPDVIDCNYQALSGTQTLKSCASYPWNPNLVFPTRNSTVIEEPFSNMQGSLLNGKVYKVAEVFLPFGPTEGYIVSLTQNLLGTSSANYNAYCTTPTVPSIAPSIISEPISTPTDAIEPVQSPSDASGLSDGAKIGIGVGAGVVGLGAIATGVGFKIYKDKQKKSKASNFTHNDDVEMNGGKRTQSVTSPITREAFTAVQGQGLKKARMTVQGNLYGREYGLYFKIDSTEAEEITQQTGLKIEFPDNQDELDLILGAGQFGQVRVAREEGTRERLFRAIKIVAGEQNVKASLREGTLQARLNGKENVLPLLEYLHYRPTVESKGEITQLLKMTFGSTVVQNQDMTTQDLLLQITPLAAFGNGWTFEDKLAQVTDLRLKNKLLNHVAYSMLTGLKNMHDDGVSHLDVKPTNFLIHTDGTVYISDFGCAQQKDKLKGGIGDFSYFSPERLAHIRSLEQQQGRVYQVKETAPLFSGKAADAWAAGITLLEIANNAYPFDCTVGVVDMLNSWDKNYYAKALTEAFTQAKQVTILPILQRLLAIEPQERWSTTQAQLEIAKSLSQDSPSTLFHSFDDDLLESEIHSPREVVNNNNLYAKKEGIYSARNDKSSSSQYYGTQLSSYHLMQQAYDEETPLLDHANNNNSRSQFVPMYNNK